MLKSQPRCETGIARPRVLQMTVDDVDSENAGLREKCCQPRCRLAGPTSRVEYSCLGWQRVATEQWRFLWPDGIGLCGQIAHHRLVSHLLSLGVEAPHGVLSVVAMRSARERDLDSLVTFAFAADFENADGADLGDVP